MFHVKHELLLFLGEEDSSGLAYLILLVVLLIVLYPIVLAVSPIAGKRALPAVLRLFVGAVDRLHCSLPPSLFWLVLAAGFYHLLITPQAASLSQIPQSEYRHVVAFSQTVHFAPMTRLLPRQRLHLPEAGRGKPLGVFCGHSWRRRGWSRRGNETISHVARTHLQKRALIPLPQSNSRKSTCGRLNKSNHRRRGLVFQPKISLVDTGFLGDLQKDRRGVGALLWTQKKGAPEGPPAMRTGYTERAGAPRRPLEGEQARDPRDCVPRRLLKRLYQKTVFELYNHCFIPQLIH